MTKAVDFLLLGGGISCAFCADNLRKNGAIGRIVILSAEGFLPYYRPQLPKSFLLEKRKKEQIFAFHENYYKKNDIEIILNTEVLAVNSEKMSVTTKNAGDFYFKHLLIATGCRPNRIETPGSSLSKIYYLSTLIDAQIIKEELKTAKNVVIYGRSFIGIELASLFMKKKIKVTIIAEEFHLVNVSASSAVAAFIANHGVEVLHHETIKQFHGIDQVHSVETNTGKIIACDFVIITDKYIPETHFLQGSGIDIDEGIIVDQYLQTNKPGIYAAGDVAQFYDLIFRRHHRNVGLDNAMKQGKIAALNMMGIRKSYYSTSYFHIQAFDNYIVIVGNTFNAQERIVRGSVKQKNFAFFYLNNGLLQGAFFSGRPLEEIKAAESLILNRVNLEPYKKHLFDLNFSLEQISAQTILTLQGGGAMGAFECGVVKAMEEYGIYPDIVSGISIGAFNSAIIAANPKHATEALEGFWNDLSVDLISFAEEHSRRLLSSWHAMVWGSPNFFYPKWLMPMFSADQLPINWTNFYESSPIKKILSNYVDFTRLKDSPTRLLVMAVNVETSEFETFDSYTDDITAEHILASGSLPPGFPWTTINNKHYWDGGVVSNTPIDATLEICGSTNKKIYIVELYPRNRPLPKNMIEVLARKDEILYSEKIRKDLRTNDLIANYKKLIEIILDFCDPNTAREIRQHPSHIQTMGDTGVYSMTRIIREVNQDELYACDTDFSRETIEQLKLSGYKTTKKQLAKEIRTQKK